MRALVLAMLVMIAPAPARAQPPSAAPIEPAQTLVQSPRTTSLAAPGGGTVRRRHRGAGYVLTIGGSLTPLMFGYMMLADDDPTLPFLLFAATAVVMPSAGHWYVGHYLTPGMFIRLCGGGVATYSLIRYWETERDAYYKMFQLGAVGVLAGVAYDLFSVGDEIDAWNRAHAPRLAPTTVGDGFGLAIAGRW